MKRILVISFLSCLILPALAGSISDRVDTRLGTTTLWTPEDLGFTHIRDKRPWGGETFPGAATTATPSALRTRNCCSSTSPVPMAVRAAVR